MSARGGRSARATAAIGWSRVSVASLVVVGTLGATATAGAGATLPPVGARQPANAANLPTCDATLFAPPGDGEGACRDGDVIIVDADRAHAAALKTLVLAVRQVAPIGRITIGEGSIGPLDPQANTWVAVTMQVRNTSGHTATVRDEQLNLRVGPTRYPIQPEASSSVPNSLTKASRTIRAGKTITGTAVFEIPVSQVATLTAAPSALLFTDFGGDFGLNGLPRHAIGSIRLYR